MCSDLSLVCHVIYKKNEKQVTGEYPSMHYVAKVAEHFTMQELHIIMQQLPPCRFYFPLGAAVSSHSSRYCR